MVDGRPWIDLASRPFQEGDSQTATCCILVAVIHVATPFADWKSLLPVLSVSCAAADLAHDATLNANCCSTLSFCIGNLF